MKKIIIGLLSLVILAGVAYKGKALMEKRKEEIVNEPLPQKEKLTVSLTKAKEGSLEQREVSSNHRVTKECQNIN